MLQKNRKGQKKLSAYEDTMNELYNLSIALTHNKLGMPYEENSMKIEVFFDIKKMGKNAFYMVDIKTKEAYRKITMIIGPLINKLKNDIKVPDVELQEYNALLDQLRDQLISEFLCNNTEKEIIIL